MRVYGVCALLWIVVLLWSSPVQAQLSLAGGFFPASQGGAGGLLSPLAGVMISTLNLERRPYAFLEVGPGFTGELIRFFFRGGIGVDFRINAWLTMGPSCNSCDVIVAQPLKKGKTMSSKYPKDSMATHR